MQGQKTTFVTRTQTIQILAKSAIQCLLTSHTPAVPQRNKAAKVIHMSIKLKGYGEAARSKRQPLQEAGYYSDTVSGTRFDNRASGLDAAYLICERNRGAVDYLFVYLWDRLGRDVSD